MVDKLLLPNLPRVLRLYDQLSLNPVIRVSKLAGFDYCEYKYYLEHVRKLRPRVLVKKALEEGKEAHQELYEESMERSKEARAEVAKVGRSISESLRDDITQEAKLEVVRETGLLKPSKALIRGRVVKKLVETFARAEREDYYFLGIETEFDGLDEAGARELLAVRAEEDAFYAAHVSRPLDTYSIREPALHSIELELIGHCDELLLTSKAIYIIDDKPFREDFFVYPNYKLQAAYYGMLLQEMTKSFEDPRPIRLGVRNSGGSILLWESGLESMLPAAEKHLEKVMRLLVSTSPGDFQNSHRPRKCRPDLSDETTWCEYWFTGCDRRCIA